MGSITDYINRKRDDENSITDYINSRFPIGQNDSITNNKVEVLPTAKDNENIAGKIAAGSAYYLGKLGTGFLKGTESISDLLGTGIGYASSGIQSIWDKEGAEETKDFWKKTVERNIVEDYVGKAVNDTYGKYAGIDAENDIATTIIEGTGEMIPSIVMGNAAVGAVNKLGIGAKALNTTNKVNKLNKALQVGGKTTTELANITNKANKLQKTANMLNIGNKVITKTAGMAPFVASATGSGISQSLQEGASFDDATKYGIASGITEGTIESISGGIGGITGNKILNKITKNSSLRTKILDTTLDVLGEGAEEAISAAINPYIKRGTYDKNAQNATSEEIGKQALMGALTSVLVKGGAKGINSANNVLNKIGSDQDISTKEIRQAVEDSKNAGISVDKIVKDNMQTVTNNTKNESFINKNDNVEVLPKATKSNLLGENIIQTLPTAKESNALNISDKGIDNVQNSISNRLPTAFEKRVDTALSNKQSNGKSNLGKVSDFAIKKIKTFLNIDVKNRNQILSDNDVRHILSQHGNDTVKTKGQQLDVVKEDIIKIPEIINNADNILKGNKNKDIITGEISDSIKYVKKYNDNTLYVVEVVPEKGNILKIKTMWKKPLVSYDNKILPYTSKTKPNMFNSTSNTNIIPQTENYASNIENSNDVMYNVNESESGINGNEQNISGYDTRRRGQSLSMVERNPLESKGGSGEETRTRNEEIRQRVIDNEIKEITQQQTEIKYKIKKQSKFYSSTLNSSVLSKEAKAEIRPNENIKYYEGITNAETFAKASKKLRDEGQSGINEFLNKEIGKTNAEDVAFGLQLMKHYQDIENYKNEALVAEKLRKIGTKGGQSIQAFSMLKRMSPEGMLVYVQRKMNNAKNELKDIKAKSWLDKNKDIIDNFNLSEKETSKIVNNMQEVQNTADERQKKILLGEIQKIMTDKIPPKRGAGLKAYMRISMLFNPKTQVRNIMGNALIAPVNAVADTFGTIADKLISAKTRVRTTALPRANSIAKGFKKGIYETYDDFKRGINTNNIQGDRFEVGRGKSFTEKNMIGRKMNQIDRILSTTLELGDRPFYEASFLNSLNGQMRANNVTNPSVDMIDIATNEALQRTWQDNNRIYRYSSNC